MYTYAILHCTIYQKRKIKLLDVIILCTNYSKVAFSRRYVVKKSFKKFYYLTMQTDCTTYCKNKCIHTIEFKYIKKKKKLKKVKRYKIFSLPYKIIFATLRKMLFFK